MWRTICALGIQEISTKSREKHLGGTESQGGPLHFSNSLNCYHNSRVKAISVLGPWFACIKVGFVLFKECVPDYLMCSLMIYILYHSTWILLKDCGCFFSAVKAFPLCCNQWFIVYQPCHCVVLDFYFNLENLHDFKFYAWSDSKYFVALISRAPHSERHQMSLHFSSISSHNFVLEDLTLFSFYMYGHVWLSKQWALAWGCTAR